MRNSECGIVILSEVERSGTKSKDPPMRGRYVAEKESLPPCGEGGQFALRIGRMRGFAEGDRAVNDCLAAIHPRDYPKCCVNLRYGVE